ncbi:MAG TPA: hypothetical protein VG733_11830 [Chthoniobacteraceae bacterium]|nr:hypothetical protein [Chthoniobacteraceae bacterium]
MAKIVGIEGMNAEDLRNEISRGGRFVMYQYCISVIFMSFRRSSNIYFIKGGHGSVAKGLPFVLISLLVGWWGIPFGLIWTIQSLVINFGGGKDVTQAVLGSIIRPVSAPSARQGLQ